MPMTYQAHELRLTPLVCDCVLRGMAGGAPWLKKVEA